MYTLLLSLVILALLYGLELVTYNQVSWGFGGFEALNDSEVVGGNGSEQVIPNQYIVMLQNNTTIGDTQLLIDELENRGAQIIGRYDELFKGFSFKTQDNQTAEKIVTFLEANPQVQSLTADREASIQPR